jgi:hypothetical protein
MSASACDFVDIAADDTTVTVRCVNCGRTVRVPQGSLNVVANCRGESETRWTKDGLLLLRSAKDKGPGSELKRLLASIGIVAKPNCACNARARVMDRQGCDWCEQHLDTIVGWLREEATKRGLPFIDAAGRLLVKRAIRNARRAAS